MPVELSINMPKVTNETFETALADVNNKRIISEVCSQFRGNVPREELTFRGHIALFNCLRKHDPTNNNKFTTSLYWHTLRQCQNAVRTEEKNALLPSLPINYESWSSNLSIDQLCVHECIDMLPSDQKEIIKNYFFDGMTLEEIGEMNGYSHVAAFKRLDKAKDAFRRLYCEE